jgi:transposase
MQNGQEIFTEKGVLLTHEQCNMYQEMFAREKEHETEILYLKQELAQLKRMIFGSKSEKCIGNDPSQLTLGLDVEPEEHPEKETQQITYTRNKTDNKKGSAIRLALPSHLHREEHIIEPGEDVTIARKIGKVVTEVLEYTPGKFYVERYVRPKYLPQKKKESLSENFPFCHKR